MNSQGCVIEEPCYDDNDEDSSPASSTTSDPTGSFLSGTGEVESKGGSDEIEGIRENVIKREDKAVRRVRIVFGIAIVVCAVIVSVSIFIFAIRGDQVSFELEYEGYVQDVINLVRWETRYNFALMQQLSATITSSITHTGAAIPYWTQPDFEISGGYVDGMGGIMMAAYAPLVKEGNRRQWEEYAVENQGWLAESAILEVAHPSHKNALKNTIQDHESDRRRLDESSEGIFPEIYRWENGTRVAEKSEPGKLYAPLWQLSPADAGSVNANLFSDDRIVDLYRAMVATNQSVLSPATQIGDLFDFLFDPEEKHRKLDAHAFIMEPIYNSFLGAPEIVGILIAVTAWENLFDRLVPDGVSGITCVVQDNFGNSLSYDLSGTKSTFLGYKDAHDNHFDAYERCDMNIEMYQTFNEELCVHSLCIYPTTAFRQTYNTRNPAVYTSVVALAFGITAILLVVYDRLITVRQEKTMRTAANARAIVTSLFPKNVGKKIIEEAEQQAENTSNKKGLYGKAGLKSFIAEHDKEAGDTVDTGGVSTKPIADLFPEATVLFGDIVGFTAWSSTREPSQVFTILEALYKSFDEIAHKRRVFKVETVGDCYVAVAGVPDPRSDHAVVMARFARDILYRFGSVTKKLEVELGPDTGELQIRIGLNSGPVTAGVLRGERARFQLFGDTMNTTSRMESTGAGNKIQISQSTADLLSAAGKGHWCHKREDAVLAKGKGLLSTFWLVSSRTERANSSTSGEGTSEEGTESKEVVGSDSTDSDKTGRLVQWISEMLLSLLRDVAAHRETSEHQDVPVLVRSNDKTVLEEVVESIPLFQYKLCQDKKAVELNPAVEQQLKDYVYGISSMYRDNNPFHCFDHASHVASSVCKLLSRIIAPDLSDEDCEQEEIDSLLHDHTYGITSDPLTQFACVFAALIHDVDHSGVPNSQLIKENPKLASFYKNRSVAEQNSVDLAWDLLMENGFKDLRQAIYRTQNEQKRFRQLVVNAVMATDIMDADLKALRNARWEKAFPADPNEVMEESPKNVVDRKATIVIEHLLQASDVAHTMQHWQIYIKWNKRLFREMRRAYIDTRMSKDPSQFWFDGERGFFDYYIIPLAKKLKDCGVFGVSSDEYLNYAEQNRQEWEHKGREIVAAWMEEETQEAN